MFYAYPSEPKEIELVINEALRKASDRSIEIESWRAMDINGSFISSKIEEKIRGSDVLVAEIGALNFNVTYEIGFAIGLGKAIVLTKNKSIKEKAPTIRDVGIFDTIGYSEYENSDELVQILLHPVSNKLFTGVKKLNKKAPIYLLETKNKTDFSTRITSRIKKARLFYRSFDPNETPRLSAHDAIKQISESLGVVVPLLSIDNTNHGIHNLRAAFLAGLSMGMSKTVTILQYGNDPIPIDYRDFVNVYNHFDDINEIIAEFAGQIIQTFQEDLPSDDKPTTSYLQQIDLGASAAENEMSNLKNYYLKTDQYLKAFRGEAQLVVGRKGSGKSAIFLQIRDKERSKSKNLVLDLKPEGYILIKFKEQILTHLEKGTFQHTITAFWEYILLLEICQKILINDKKRHMMQTELFEPYAELERYYKLESSNFGQGDFSERLSRLIEHITIKYNETYHGQTNVRLTTPKITDILYKNDITVLKEKLKEYLRHKERVIILFDNIDKGWPSSGLDSSDLMIIRTLINASRNLQRSFDKIDVGISPIIFLRNDVYELLVKETSDRQKESKILLDWVDGDLLREVIKLRISSNLEENTLAFEEYWRRICVSHINGEETSQYLIERSLMRPRFLINLINQCKSFAINFNHSRIEADDIEKGTKSFSTDLLTDISYEIQDILPYAQDVLYGFIGSRKNIPYNQLIASLKEFCQFDEEGKIPEVVNLLLWYGFLGIKIKDEEPKFIYDFNYNNQILNGLIKKNHNEIRYSINPGFWPALMIS